MLREGACLQIAERLKFRTPKRKAFLADLCIFFGNLRSVNVLRSLYEVLCEFFLNKLRKHGGTSSPKLLKIIVLEAILSFNYPNNLETGRQQRGTKKPEGFQLMHFFCIRNRTEIWQTLRNI